MLAEHRGPGLVQPGPTESSYRGPIHLAGSARRRAPPHSPRQGALGQDQTPAFPSELALSSSVGPRAPLAQQNKPQSVPDQQGQLEILGGTPPALLPGALQPRGPSGHESVQSVSRLQGAAALPVQGTPGREQARKGPK
ncbi:hypothetical protein NDU88_003939 [Pleurodeles waltl]|uniref:Uncharacterized protein n=1 Tax=Pleurodeles waltl TaxID=8319 RepID=A0AAV7T6A5_PLEWA|nr:hypothetical protein NDU88_003939 [Pleurodeles waltl]